MVQQLRIAVSSQGMVRIATSRGVEHQFCPSHVPPSGPTHRSCSRPRTVVLPHHENCSRGSEPSGTACVKADGGEVLLQSRRSHASHELWRTCPGSMFALLARTESGVLYQRTCELVASLAVVERSTCAADEAAERICCSIVAFSGPFVADTHLRRDSALVFSVFDSLCIDTYVLGTRFLGFAADRSG